MLNLEKELKIPVLDKGFIILKDWMGSDQDIVDAARVSYGKGTRSSSDNQKLINYLIKNKHTSPFEQCEIKFHLKMPIFVARQYVRHRTACLGKNVILNFDLGSNSSRIRSYPITIGKFYKMWNNEIVQKTGSKIKDTFCEKINENEYYSIPKLSKLIERREGTIRKCIREGYLKAERRIAKKITDPVLFVKGSDYHIWANKIFISKVILKDKIKNMRLRSVDTHNNEIIHTSVIDIWKNGKKPIFNLITETGKILKGLTLDHVCLTDKGMLRVKDFFNVETQQSNAKICILLPSPETPFEKNSIDIEIDEDKEKWRWIPGYELSYEISSYGRVKSYKNNRLCIMKLSNQEGYNVVSLQDNTKMQHTCMVQHLVAKAWLDSPTSNEFCLRHKNGNRKDNRPDNLEWGTKKRNSEDTVLHNNTTKLRCFYDNVINLDYIGIEETYDISVKGPFHNFSADGFIVHNSINEYSARYSIIDDEGYVPSPSVIHSQSKSNKQGRDEESLSDYEISLALDNINESSRFSYETYKYLLNEDDSPNYDKKRKGIARELARIVLPVNFYTQFYWKMDLHNLLHFLELRLDKHAQYEIRAYAEEIAKIVKEWVPITWNAFKNYRLESVILSRDQWKHFMYLLRTGGNEYSNLYNLSKNEIKEVQDLFYSSDEE